jgi:hypothetical protein
MESWVSRQDIAWLITNFGFLRTSITNYLSRQIDIDKLRHILTPLLWARLTCTLEDLSGGRVPSVSGELGEFQILFVFNVAFYNLLMFL